MNNQGVRPNSVFAFPLRPCDLAFCLEAPTSGCVEEFDLMTIVVTTNCRKWVVK
jgi:hypothetical protein